MQDLAQDLKSKNKPKLLNLAPTKVVGKFEDLINLKPESIAIFGGSFDPPQIIHKQIFDYLKTQHDCVIIIPTAFNPLKHRRPYATDSQRLDMLKLITNDCPNCYLLTSEIDSGGSSTYWTLKQARQFFPDQAIKLYVGSDCLERFHTWLNYTAIPELAELVPIIRKGAKVMDVTELANNVGKKLARQILAARLDLNLDAVSSTEVRSEIAADVESWQEKVPEAVRQYIIENKLYSRLGC